LLQKINFHSNKHLKVQLKQKKIVIKIVKIFKIIIRKLSEEDFDTPKNASFGIIRKSCKFSKL